MNILLKVERLRRRSVPDQDVEPIAGPGVSRVFGPSAGEFLERAFLNRAFEVPASETDVGPELLPWEDIDWMFQSQRFWEGRATLYQSGREVPFTDLVEQSVEDASRTLRRPTAYRIDPLRIYRMMKEGGTLVVRGVDEVHRGLRELTQQLQRELMAPVSTFLFVSGGVQVGVGAHWDAWDSLVVQVHGRKRWKVAGETKPRPLRFDSDVPRPNNDAFREIKMSAGDVLYLPRGHWHEVTSYDEPSVHLTFNIRALPNIDAVVANLGRLAAVEGLRAPFQNGAIAESGTDALREAVLELASPKEVRQHFLRNRAEEPMHKHFNMLECTWNYAVHLSPKRTIRSSAPYRFEAVPEPTAGTLKVFAGGFEWTFASHAAPLLAALGRGDVLTVEDSRRLVATDDGSRPDSEEWSEVLRQLIRLQFIEFTGLDIG